MPGLDVDRHDSRFYGGKRFFFWKGIGVKSTKHRASEAAKRARRQGYNARVHEQTFRGRTFYSVFVHKRGR